MYNIYVKLDVYLFYCRIEKGLVILGFILYFFRVVMFFDVIKKRVCVLDECLCGIFVFWDF